MKVYVAALALLLTQAVGLQVSSSSSVTFSTEAKKTAMTKVVKLLQDMLKKMEGDAKADKLLAEEHFCWCKTNKAQKTDSIAKGTVKNKELEITIGNLFQAMNRLRLEARSSRKELAGKTAENGKAIALRTKENKKFKTDEADLLSAIASLGGALKAIMKISLVQGEVSSSDASSVNDAMLQLEPLLDFVLPPDQRTALSAFVQAAAIPDAKLKKLAEKDKYEAGSVGPLKQMKKDFESNLRAMQKEEAASKKTFIELKTLREAEMAAITKNIAAKTSDLADKTSKRATAKADNEGTIKALASDKTELATVQKICIDKDAEFAARLKSRSLEMEAVNAALTVLNSEDARIQFTKTMRKRASFLQTQATRHSAHLSQAADILSGIAKQTQNELLDSLPSFVQANAELSLAERVQLGDAFHDVAKAITGMVDQLGKEHRIEGTKKAKCSADTAENKAKTKAETETKKALGLKIDSLKADVKKYTDQRKALKKELANAAAQMAKETEERKKVSAAFQVTVAEQQATIQLLKKAINVLTPIFAKKLFFVQDGQEAQSAGTAPVSGSVNIPEEKKKHHGAAKTIIAMLGFIATDAETVIKVATKADKKDQTDFEKFTFSNQAVVKAKNQETNAAKANHATAKTDLMATQKKMNFCIATLGDLAKTKADLFKQCDFLLKNFKMRTLARIGEMTALKQAKAVLSNTKFTKKLPRKKKTSASAAAPAPAPAGAAAPAKALVQEDPEEEVPATAAAATVMQEESEEEAPATDAPATVMQEESEEEALAADAPATVMQEESEEEAPAADAPTTMIQEEDDASILQHQKEDAEDSEEE